MIVSQNNFVYFAPGPFKLEYFDNPYNSKAFNIISIKNIRN